MKPNKKIQALLARKPELEKLGAKDLIKHVVTELGTDFTLAHSLSAEDTVLTDMLFAANPKFNVFTLDTGRLNPESYELLARLTEKYKLNIKIYFPEKESVEKMVNEKGINLFYESLENRKLCCGIRKVEPLNRALKGYSAWICGLRKGQGATRAAVEKIEVDTNHGGILKINPLADWSFDEVMQYLKDKSIPYNRLYDQGYTSIGCAPCTRAIKPGQSERDGRWWWENPDSKECGLHAK